MKRDGTATRGQGRGRGRGRAVAAESAPVVNQEKKKEDRRPLRLQIKDRAVSGQIRKDYKKSVHFAETRHFPIANAFEESTKTPRRRTPRKYSRIQAQARANHKIQTSTAPTEGEE
jgi:hypothetical protein